jgi:peptidoglycan/xylan/chitin deacetylase (PgdA/CDA1 family)
MQSKGEVMTSISTGKDLGTIAFTFDDGISRHMPRLLDILDKEGIVGTFFIIGESLKIQKNFDIAVDAHKRGHILANHTWSHPNITKITGDELRKELSNCEMFLEKVRGPVEKKFFRPPYGAINKACAEILRSKGYTSFLWNIDMNDWDVKRSKQQIHDDYEKLFSTASPLRQSFISLQHDRRLDSVELVPEIAKLAGDKGFKIVPLEAPLVSVV